MHRSASMKCPGSMTCRNSIFTCSIDRIWLRLVQEKRRSLPLRRRLPTLSSALPVSGLGKCPFDCPFEPEIMSPPYLLPRPNFRGQPFVPRGAKGWLLLRSLAISWMAFVNVISIAAADLRIGIIGCDTSHVIAFTETLNNPLAKGHIAGGKVVAAFKGGSQDIPASANRVE